MARIDRSGIALARRIALTLLICLSAPTRADAICGSIRTDLFELAERAPAIAVVHAGADGRLVVERSLRGAASIWARPSSRPRPRPGSVRRRGRTLYVPMEECAPAAAFELRNQRAIVFANTNARPFNGFGRSEIVFETRSPTDATANEIIAAVTDWIAADTTARTTQLLRWISRPGPQQADAIRHLGRAPEILARLTPADRITVVHAIEARLAAGTRPAEMFDVAVTLARLHEPAAWDALVRTDRFGSISEVGFGSAEMRTWLFDHAVDELHGGGIEAWTAWRRALAASRADRDAMLLQGFRERSQTIASLTDRHGLALAIRSGRWIDRVVATDLCEQALGARIPWPRPSPVGEPLATSGSAIFDGQGVEDASAWTAVAAACETGVSSSSPAPSAAAPR